MRLETLKFRDLVQLILEVWRYSQYCNWPFSLHCVRISNIDILSKSRVVAPKYVYMKVVALWLYWLRISLGQKALCKHKTCPNRAYGFLLRHLKDLMAQITPSKIPVLMFITFVVICVTLYKPQREYNCKCWHVHDTQISIFYFDTWQHYPYLCISTMVFNPLDPLCPVWLNTGVAFFFILD